MLNVVKRRGGCAIQRLPDAERERLLALARRWYERGAEVKLRDRTGEFGPVHEEHVEVMAPHENGHPILGPAPRLLGLIPQVDEAVKGCDGCEFHDVEACTPKPMARNLLGMIG
ncbi:hypothetical protein [Streptomyces sp. NBC_00503]|uniref:hypothetical protein n=1 Tax=Streptomyces sp. NBC_00503 TaxID=2903659 RepID=UPI002E81F67E|nr:hypothetical protein [Streptomyces sp. NBC_00503]WUD79234.1 hypothetical protein OG490_00835 [Streptomyces sp. NBC_00503]